MRKFLSDFCKAAVKQRLPRARWIDFYSYCIMAERNLDGATPNFVLQEMYEKESKKSHRKILQSIIFSLSEGDHLSVALEGHLPSDELMIIKAADTTGDYANAFEAALNLANFKSEIRRSKYILLYPISLLIIFASIYAFYLTPELRPVTEALFRDPRMTLPFITTTFYSLMNLVNSWAGLFVLIGIIFSWLMLKASYAYWKPANPNLPNFQKSVSGRLRSFADKYVPGFKGYRELTSFTFLVALGGLLRSVDIDKAIKILAPSCSPWLRVYVDAMAERLAGGDNPDMALGVGLVPQALDFQYHIYNKSNALLEVLKNPPEQITEKIRFRVSSVVKSLTTFLMIVVFAFILWAYFASMEPAWMIHEHYVR